MKLLEAGPPPAKLLTMKTAPTKRTSVKLGVVLVPTDFSRASIQALDYAAWLLERFEGELHLVHVDEPDYSYAVPSLLAMGPVVSPGEIERTHRGRLGRLAQKHAPPNREVFTHVLSGRAYLDICQLAGEIDAGMIVMSTRGQTGLKRVLLGSTLRNVSLGMRPVLCWWCGNHTGKTRRPARA